MHQKPLTLTLLIFVSLIFSATIRADSVDDLVLSRLKERNIPGAAVAVIKDGKVVKLKGYGLASVEFGVPVMPETVFEAGSVSKQMTAAAIMLLVEDGKVLLDAPVSDYLPNTPESWKDVTLRHLLTHTSGIKSYSSLDGFELSNRHKAEQFIEKLAPHPLEFVPGEKAAYNNSGFNLLAYIVESASGKPFMEFMRTRIFTPLRMTKTTERDPQYIVMNRAIGYEWRNGRLAGRDGNLTNLMGAGSIITTVADMVKWNAALSGDKFLSPASKAAMWKQSNFNDGKLSPYGFGWRINEIRGHKLIGHTGQTAGFGAANFRYVDDGVIVIVMTNLGELGMGGMLASAIAKIYVPQLSLKKMNVIDDARADFSKKIMTAIQGRIDNKPNAELLSDPLFRRVTNRRAKTENDRIAAFGPIKKLSLVGLETIDNKHTYLYTADTGKRLFLWRIVANYEGKIDEMTLDEEE